MRWERLKVVGGASGPGKRWGHTCNAIRGGKLLYVFGGYGKHNCQTNQVHVFDTATQTWIEPAIKGMPPSPRDSHSCTTVGDKLFVFGGTDGLNPLRDLHILDTISNTWISPNLRGDGPAAREGHSAALIGKRLFIFGGCGKPINYSKEVYYNDLYILNTETFVWQHAVTSGTPPSARDSHTCSSWKNKIIVIGGEDGHDYYLSDVHVLDTDTLVWKELHTSGQLLTPRAGHSTVAFGKHIFVVGGFSDAQNLYNDVYMLDMDTGVWTKIMPTGDGPSARFSMSADCVDPSMSGVLVFISGCNKNLEALDDMYYLHTELVRESGSGDQRLEKLSLRKQLKMKCQERYLPAANDRALFTVESADLNSDTSVPSHSQQSEQRIHLNSYRPPSGKRTFMAKVVQNVGTGIIVETVIDGKPLRGILFSTKTSNDSTSEENSSRKRGAGKAGEGSMNGGEEDMTSREPHTEAANVATVPDCGPSEAGPSNEASDGNPAPSKKPRVNYEEDKADDTSDASNLASQENAAALQDSSSPKTQDGRT
ncbi:hypothetical protein Ancab_036053 [Ancistrocladus abbreviatus]